MARKHLNYTESKNMDCLIIVVLVFSLSCMRIYICLRFVVLNISLHVSGLIKYTGTVIGFIF